MKIDVNDNLTISGGAISSSKYGISEENAPFVIKMMIDNLYSNKPLAIIREYITNAWDAHLDAGIKDTPIHITVPTSFRPKLVIRDFGKGLSKDDVLHFYTQMADSRKRHTDDFVGGFGIGCKCAFCYVPSFTVTSFHNGTKMVFNASSSGAVPEMNLFFEESTTETGFMVEIDIKPADVYTFRNTLADFLQFFTPKPVIFNDDYFRITENSNKLLEMDDWYCIDDNYADNKVILGNVPYTFSKSMLQLEEEHLELANGLKSIRFVIQMSANDLNVTLNRESLEYTPKTIQNLKSKYVECISQVKSALTEKYKYVSSVWEAKALYKKLGQKFNLFPVVDGVSISNYAVNLGSLVFKERKSKINEKRWGSDNNVLCCDATVIFIARPNITANSIRPRIYEWMNSNGIDKTEYSNKYHYFVFATNDDADAFVNSTHIRGANIVELDTVPYVKVTPKTSRMTRVQSPCYVFRNGWGHCHFIDCKADLGNDSGVYVPIAHYKPTKMYYHLADMNCYENIMAVLGIDNIYGVKNVDIPKLGDGWVRLDVYLQSQFDKFISENPEALMTFILTREIPRAYMEFAENIDFDYRYKDLYEKIASYKGDYSSNVTKIRKLASYGATYSCPEADLLIQMHKEASKEYSFMEFIDVHSNLGTYTWDIVRKYVKMHELAW